MKKWLKPSSLVMGVDPGLELTGVAVIRTAPALEIVHAELIKTKKADKKERRHVRVTNDDLKRYNEIFKRLLDLIDEFSVGILGVEAYTAGRPGISSAGAKTAIIYGGIVALGASRDLFVVPFLPSDLKRKFCGKQSGSKNDVAAGVAQEVVGFEDARVSFAKTKREHISDAAAVAVLAVDEVLEVMKILGIGEYHPKRNLNQE